MDRLYSLVLSFLYAVVIAGSLTAAISASGSAKAQASTITTRYDLPLTCRPPNCGGAGAKCTAVRSGPYTNPNCARSGQYYCTCAP